MTIDDLNDDALGHALDKLHAAGGAAVFGALCTRVAVLEEVRHEFLHWDSTSRSFCGDDDDLADGAVNVTHGYSKNHRPDLKQIVLTLLANREGMPLWGSVENGNSSDRRLNNKVLGQIYAAFSPTTRVGDLRGGQRVRQQVRSS